MAVDVKCVIFGTAFYFLKWFKEKMLSINKLTGTSMSKYFN